MLTRLFLRFQYALIPALVVVAVGAVLIEQVFHVETCPIRDWALVSCGLYRPHKHRCYHKEH